MIQNPSLLAKPFATKRVAFCLSEEKPTKDEATETFAKAILQCWRMAGSL